jgi:glycosyltransferase involved in cell wall biosynthesis
MKITPAGDDAGGDAVRHGVVRQVRDAVRGAASRICPALERYALRRSTQVAVGSETSRGRLLAAGVEPGRLHLLPAWSPVAPSTLTRVAARRELGWEQARFIAVHAGPLGHRQDGVTIVEAARLLAADSGLLSEIVLAGDGPRRAALEQLAFGIPGLRFMGGVDDETLPLVLAAADVLLVAETSPAGAATASGQLASYLAAGRPVVAVSWPSSPTAAELRRAGAGLRVPPGDPAALARALAGLRPAVARQGAMGRAALRYARAHLGREASLRRLDAIVEAALTEPGSH